MELIFIIIFFVLALIESVYIIHLETKIKSVEEINAISSKAYDEAMEIIRVYVSRIEGEANVK